MNNEEIKNAIECLLFISDKPLSIDILSKVLEIEDKNKILKAVRNLGKDYRERNTGLQVSEIAKGYRICTKGEYAGWIRKLYKSQTTYQISQSALETLSIVAYKQPITRAEIEKIRGVDISGVLRGLLEKKLIKVSGRKACPGRPLLYRTTEKFLLYFGLKDLGELPELEEIKA